MIVLVKLAAIGDVAMACRALNDFVAERDTSGLEFLWIIDDALVELARALTHPEIRPRIRWHSVDAGKLLKGSLSEKVGQAAAIARVIFSRQPSHVLLLHRDWRYRAAIRPMFPGRILSPGRSRALEVESYREVFRALAGSLRLPQRESEGTNDSAAGQAGGKIGVLLGGARNAGVVFLEKRWPGLEALVRRLLSDTDKTVVLLGGPEDQEISRRLGSHERIEDRVGRLALHELPSMMKGLDAFVSIDSGLAHIAAAVMSAPHQRVVTLFGPTDPAVWSPVSLDMAEVRTLYKAAPCSPCYRNDGKFRACKFEGERFQHCMTAIGVEEVFRSLVD